MFARGGIGRGKEEDCVNAMLTLLLGRYLRIPLRRDLILLLWRHRE